MEESCIEEVRRVPPGFEREIAEFEGLAGDAGVEEGVTEGRDVAGLGGCGLWCGHVGFFPVTVGF